MLTTPRFTDGFNVTYRKWKTSAMGLPKPFRVLLLTSPDGTAIEVDGRWATLYRAADGKGQTISFWALLG